MNISTEPESGSLCTDAEDPEQILQSQNRVEIVPLLARSLLVTGVIIGSLGLAGCHLMASKSSSPLKLQGQIVGEEILVSAKAPGQVQWVGVYARDRVAPGQVLLRLDETLIQQKIQDLQQQSAAAEQQAMQSRFQQQVLRRQLQQTLLVSQSTLPSGETGTISGSLASLQTQLQEAEAGLKQAQSARDRLVPLVKAGALARQQLVAAEAQVRQSKEFVDQTLAAIATIKGQSAVAASPTALVGASQSVTEIQKAVELVQTKEKNAVQKVVLFQKQLKALQQQLTGLSIQSPFAGRVTQQMVEMNSPIKPGQPLLKLVKTETIAWQGNVPGDQVRLLVVGQSARIKLQGHPQGWVNAKVTGVQSPSAGGAAPVQLQFTEDELGLAVPGSNADAEINIREN
jgi:multidrug resistance efflux pump